MNLFSDYTEFFTPFLVKPNSAITTGQLPKFDEDMYHIEKDELYKIIKCYIKNPPSKDYIDLLFTENIR